MAKTFKYLRMRAVSTKDTRQLRQNDVTPVKRYNNVFDLTTVSLGGCLSIGCLVVIGQVTQSNSGPSVILAIIISVIITLLISLNYAELQSRLPRVQSSTYEHLFYVGGECSAFMVQWSEMITLVLYAAAISRSISANLDMLTNGSIHNLTASHTADVLPYDSYLDFVGFLLVLICMLYIAIGGNNNFNNNTVFYNISNLCILVLLMFLGIVGAFHFDFNLWKPDNFFPFGFTGILSGASLLVPVLLSQKTSLSLCDFMWLGIKPTVLGTINLTAVLSLFFYLAMAGLISLLAPVSLWTGDAVICAAFEAAGVHWVKYLISPVIILVLLPYSVIYLISSVRCMEVLCKDQLLHHCLGVVWNDANVPLVSLLLLSVTTALLTFLLSIQLILRVLCVLTLLEVLLVCSIVITLRSKPAPQQQLRQLLPEESSTSLDSPLPVAQQTDTYGALPVTSAIRPNQATRQEYDDDIDLAVEEYRLHRAAAQCYQGVVHSNPTKDTYQRTKVSMVIFVSSLLCMFVTIIHGMDQLGEGRVPVILALVMFIILVLCSLVVICVQPRDKVLPSTFLIQLPTQPWMSLATVVIVTLLLSFLGTTEWLISIGCMLFGLLLYVIHVLCAHDSSYSQFNNESITVQGQMDSNDLHQLATFVPKENGILGEDEDDDNILVP